ncbi:MAG: uracil-DNA glycosylase [Methanobacteriota archaeon]|nr:MAG: uracil-DNA glycosylase [Euryarchaeota archaeon]
MVATSLIFYGLRGPTIVRKSPNRKGTGDRDSLERVTAQVVDCRRCPRLVRYRQEVARSKRAAFRDWEYWGRPVPGFGDPGARLLVVGLAPAAHGGNRTGRVFTGDRSGEWLFGALHRNGFANQAASVSKSDGLRLRDCYIAAAVRCAPPGNRPTPAEFRNCQPYLEREVRLLSALRVVVPLGAVAMNAFLRTWRAIGHDVPVPKPRFGHGVTLSLPPIELVASYHPSQRNTQTGLLTEPMFDGVFREALRLLEGGREQIFSREAAG